MTDPAPSFPTLLQRFFVEHLGQQRAVSPRTIAAYRDTFRLLLGFAEARIGKAPATFSMTDFNAKLILDFLDYLERDRQNAVRSRNARLVALRSFLKYAAHHDLTTLAVIEQALSIPMKRFDRRMLGFLTRDEIQAILEAPDAGTWAGQRDRALFSILYNRGDQPARSGRCHRRRVGDRPPARERAQTAKCSTLEADSRAAPWLDETVARSPRGKFRVS